MFPRRSSDRPAAFYFAHKRVHFTSKSITCSRVSFVSAVENEIGLNAMQLTSVALVQLDNVSPLSSSNGLSGLLGFAKIGLRGFGFLPIAAARRGPYDRSKPDDEDGNKAPDHDLCSLT